MTREEFIERVSDLFPAQGCCSETIVLAGAELLGVDSELIPAVANGFCGGMMYEKETCGALTGAIIVLGLAARHRDGLSLEVSVPELLEHFRSRHGSVNCFELTSLDLRDPEQMDRLDIEKCRQFVRSAAGHLYDLVELC